MFIMKNLLLRRLFLLVFFSSIFIIGVSQELVTSNYTKFIKVDYMVYDMNQDNEKTDDEIVDIDSRVYNSAGNTIKVRFVLYKGGETLEFNHIYSNIKFYVAKEQGLINYVLFDRFDEPIFGLIQLKDKRYVFILDDLSLLVNK